MMFRPSRTTYLHFLSNKIFFLLQAFQKQFQYPFWKTTECEHMKLNDCAKLVAMAELSVHERRSNKFYKIMKQNQTHLQNQR
ncbi:hypothetical protein PR048_015388 [Dryococelus australis]|uniref:Uncharacterized protein n=1 Tax=Dryococelus australis TaxID=614101 RepID=A0ABQ9HGU5_9NEOP|nr:hypothetical protein PR048_015388 [Dryococelus australis]